MSLSNRIAVILHGDANYSKEVQSPGPSIGAPFWIPDFALALHSLRSPSVACDGWRDVQTSLNRLRRV